MSWGIELETEVETVEAFDGHTYNLSPMWRLAGVFGGHSSELDGRTASEVGVRAAQGLLRAVTHPEEFKALNPSNGWGDFDGFVSILTCLSILCAEHPTAIVKWNG